MDNLLDSINTPEDLKKIKQKDLPFLAKQVREYILEVVSSNGGHLGAALGVVDLTIALHYCFQTPKDSIIWDVGHQAHAHKILTGRRQAFKTFRQEGGLSGFPNKDESTHDPFTTGHGGASISTALGMAVAHKLQSNEDRKIIAVIGDASLASGMAFEALNHAGHLKDDLIVILNDNEMSISPTVGALSRSFNRILSSGFYNHLRTDIATGLKKIPKVGDKMAAKARQIDEGLKHLFVPGLIFEELGFRYFGPLDGHNITGMIQILNNISKIKGPILLHVVTKKGKGYEIAECSPEKWHASSPFHLDTGKTKKNTGNKTYTEIFGEVISKHAQNNPKIVAITAAMCEGTGLMDFARKFPARFFDVGIAEEHAVSFAAGLAKAGLRPVVAVYSTFLQRGYDQVIHDVALQNLPVLFCLDRAGLVGEDGPTHHGVFDISFLRKIPGFTLMAPRDGRELELMIDFVMKSKTLGPVAIRYPRGEVAEMSSLPLSELKPLEVRLGEVEVLKKGNHVLFMALGSMVYSAYEAATQLEKKGIECTVVNARFVKPLSEESVVSLSKDKKLIVTLEEGSLLGGFGSALLQIYEAYQKKKPTFRIPLVRTLGVPDRFITHGKRASLLDALGLSCDEIVNEVVRLLSLSQGKAEVFLIDDNGRMKCNA